MIKIYICIRYLLHILQLYSLHNSYQFEDFCYFVYCITIYNTKRNYDNELLWIAMV